MDKMIIFKFSIFIITSVIFIILILCAFYPIAHGIIYKDPVIIDSVSLFVFIVIVLYLLLFLHEKTTKLSHAKNLFIKNIHPLTEVNFMENETALSQRDFSFIDSEIILSLVWSISQPEVLSKFTSSKDIKTELMSIINNCTASLDVEPYIETLYLNIFSAILERRIADWEKLNADRQLAVIQ